MWLDVFLGLLVVAGLANIRAESQYIIGDDVTLPCQSNNVTAGQTYVWGDQVVNPDLIIYQVNDVTDIEQTGQAASKEKYNNFEVQNSYPTSVNMIIKDIQPEDAPGPYQCYEFDDLEQIALHSITLEGISESVEVNCTRQTNNCPSSVSVSVSSVFTCTCTAVAAYPNTLHLVWTGAAESIPSSSMESSETGLFDYHGEAVITPTDVMSEVKCVLTGYTNSIDERERSATYTFSPPSCTLDVDFTPDCKTANLTCRCSGAPNPGSDDLVYGFYDEDGALIGGEQAEDEMTLIDLDPDQMYYSFSCRGCNGLNYGDEAYATTDVICIPPPPYAPVCNVRVSSIRDDCRDVQLECLCDAEPDEYSCSFYNDGSLIPDTVGCSVNTNVNVDTITNYTCKGTNGAGTGQESSHVSQYCFREPRTTEETTTSETTTSSCDKSAVCAGHVAGLAVEAVIITLLAVIFGWFVYTTRKRSAEKHGATQPVDGLTSAENSAYMDLHERPGGSQKRSTEIPVSNVKIISTLPGRGLMTYQRATLTTNTGNRDAVVKSSSDEAPVKLETIWSSEMSSIQSLPEHANVVDIFGWCNSVPRLLLLEHVNGGNLTKHLTENFSSQEVHQYGNTKQKRFEVHEKGQVENLPRYAIGIARGLKFLLSNQFIHPGLRAQKVLVDLSGRCKIYDFVSINRAKDLTKLSWAQSTPYQWLPPEFLFLGSVGATGDVWSFGVLMWEIFSYGSQPYLGKDRDVVEACIRREERLPMPRNCPGAVWQLMNRCWDQSTDTRPAIEEVASRLAAMCNEDKEYDEITRTNTKV